MTYHDLQKDILHVGDKNLRMYCCPKCGCVWYEDCDATDYPYYCPGCGDGIVD